MEQERHAWLCLTDACQNNCTWCYERHLKCGNLTEMPLENALRQVELLAQLSVKTLMLLGGEPLLYPNLLDVVRHGKDLGMFVGLITNGRLVSSHEFMPVMEAVDMIALTLYSLDPDTHDRITQATGSWEETLAGMVATRKAEKDCAVNLVVGQENKRDALDTLEFLLEYGFPTVISSARPMLYEAGGRTDGEGSLHPREFASIVKRCVSRFGADNECTRYVFETPLCLLDRDILRLLLDANRIDTLCKVGRNRVVVTTSGKVVACSTCPIEVAPELSDSPDFEELFENTVTKIRERRLPRRDCCKGCLLWENCQGGCPTGWVHWGHEKIASPITTWQNSP